MSAASEYAELLKLIEVSGPFMSLPVFREVFPQGLVKDAPDITRELRELYTEWRAARALAPHTVSPAQREWLRAVFTTLLEWPAEWLAEANAIPQNLSHFVAQHHETLRPDLALIEDGKPRLLISLLPPSQQPDRRPAATTWNATCANRMAELLRATRIPLGLVTNGERFTLVYAEPEKPTGFADFRAELWFDERLTLRAFRDFLSAGALFNRPPEQTLDALYRRSLENQQEVSTTLGRQVRRAVEMFVAALDRADRESGRVLLAAVREEHVYEAALSLMMRLVFLFFAEERDLLPITNPVYREHYAVSTLHDQLREAADRLGEEVLERRYDAFPRLLATFRGVHGGIGHDLAALPAYGGDLFDPDRFPFLEGRPADSAWRTVPAQPCPIHNRTVLHLLGALQFLEMRVPGGGREKRRLSFRALDIEQIGQVYEGLLDHTARRATEVVLGLEGKEDLDVALSELQRLRAQPEFVEWLADETGRGTKAIEKALQQTAIDDPVRWPQWEQVAPFSGLVRRDDNGEPWVVPTGSIYVTAGTARRQSGTQYTPRTLTESVVEHALAPLVYTGPAEGQPQQDWRLNAAAQILDLKICDFACGSAAFLVAAARYLSSHLVEAWDAAQREHGAGVQITPYGNPSSGLQAEELIPANPDERALYALRIVVERCLYGVDHNPLAVEMAKLSLWLLTLQRSRPFTFLDHAIRCGDSLLGVDLKQLSTWSLSGEGTQSVLFDDDLNFAADKREGLMKMQYRTGDQRRLLYAALAKTRRLRAAADRLIATAFEANPEASAAAVSMGLEEQETEARKILEGKRPFHWAVEFPEIFRHGGGFDAIISNPPFKAGRFLSAHLGQDYLKYLQAPPFSLSGQADYCAAFATRALSLCRRAGFVGLITTKTISEGATRRAFLDPALEGGGRLIWVKPLVWWPGVAQVVVSLMVIERSRSRIQPLLDDTPQREIDSTLSPVEVLRDGPLVLTASSGLVAKGVGLGSDRFVLDAEDGPVLCERDAFHVRRYIGGIAHNSALDGWGGKFVFYFQDVVDEHVLGNLPSGRFFLQRLQESDRIGEFWKYRRSADRMFGILRESRFCIIRAQTSSTWTFSFWPKEDIFDQSVIVFGTNCEGLWSILNSSIHEAWAGKFGRLMKTDTAYAPSDSFNNFPLPYDPLIKANSVLAEIARRFSALRQVAERDRGGKTPTYAEFHNPESRSAEIGRLRALHVEMDHSVVGAYGWTNLDLGHGFHQTKQGIRYTISEPARRTVLDRLLVLNHGRYAEEQAAVRAAPRPKPKARKRAPDQADLF